VLPVSTALIAGCLLFGAPASALAETGGISGKITEAGTSTPIEGIEACAFTNTEESTEEPFTAPPCAKSDAGGAYTIAGLSPGGYFVAFAPPFMSSLNFVPEYYDGKLSPSEADQVTVQAGADSSGVDAKLEPGAEISGHVTEAGTGAPLEGILVCALGPTGGSSLAELASCARTAAGGAYTVNGLGTGNYTVVFFGGLSFASQVYNDRQAFTEADPVTVSARGLTSGIDAALTPASVSALALSTPLTPLGGAPGASRVSPTRLATAKGLTLAGTRIPVRHGRAALALRCNGTAKCRGVLTLTTRRTIRTGRKTLAQTVVVSASRSLTVAPGALVSVQLRLNDAGGGLLYAGRGLLNAHLVLQQPERGEQVQRVVLQKDSVGARRRGR
jgi:hypothetical protein